MEEKNTELKKDFYVVGIGASAGGLDAIQQLFDNVPEDTGMAFIIIQHLSPDFKSLMPELLSKHTKMKIFTAADKQVIKPNCIYLNQRNKNLHIKGRKLYLLDKGPKHNLNLPIDIFFHTLGEEYKEKSIGVILSGTGSDGSRGIKTIKEGGGTIIVQDPASAQFDGMPNSSISTNLVDFIVSADKISDALFRFPHTKLTIGESDVDQKSDDIIFYNILEEILKHSGIDFRKYKRNTLIRRLEKRMSINNLDRLQDYYIFLKANGSEKETLKQDFLIGVTRFFRDTEAFDLMRKVVIPNICKDKKDTEAIRIWTPGCSTGEETYSIAILLDEHIRANKYNFDFKIFASDVDARAIATAGLGRFDINIGNEIEKKYLESYFLKTGDKIQIIKRIREKVVFSKHNILKDPPFIRMDLITCRNMLIYFDNTAQAKVMQNFQFSLNKYGYLFLGNSESLGAISKSFKTIDSKWKIFQNISDIKQLSPQNNPEKRIDTFSFSSTPSPSRNLQYRFKENPESIFHQYLSKKHSPASIFVDADYNILFIRGDAGKRLSHQEGLFQNNLLKMVSPEIASVVRTGIRRLESEKKDVTITGVVNKVEDEQYVFDLNFHKPRNSEKLQNIYLLQFGEEKNVSEEGPIIIKNLPIDDISKQRFEDLENELKSTKVELQNVVEELETSNEELQSSNEELMASNEELQSTNEELQSVNEELYTVNSELQEKNKELLSVNNDISNLLDSTDIGTLFLDNNLRIRKFTPALQKHFKLHETDIGRPISSFTANFDEKTRLSFIEDSKSALEKLNVIEKEVVDLDGNPFFKKINPFITLDKKIDGVVITLIDIQKLKKVEKEQKLSELRYRTLFENLNEGFAHAKILRNSKGEPADWQFITVNPAFEKHLGIGLEEVIGRPFLKNFKSFKEDSVNWLDKFGHTAITGEDQFVEGYSNCFECYCYVNIFSPAKGEFAATFSDITELKEKEQALVQSQYELKRAQKIANMGSWYMDLETNEVTWTEGVFKTFGLGPEAEPPRYPEHQKMYTPESWETLSSAIENVQKTGTPYKLEVEIIKSDGSKGWILAQGETAKDREGKVVGLRGIAQDITERKIIDLELRFEQEFSQKITELTPAGIYIYNLEKGTNEFMNVQYTNILGYTMEEINKMNLTEFNSLFHPDDAEMVQNHMKSIIEGQFHDKIEYRFKHKKGHWVWCYSVDSPFQFNKEGKVISFIGVFIDITELKDTVLELHEARNKAEAANIHKNYFLANMSHEIRTPMNGVLGFANLLKRDNLTQELRNKYIDIINGNSKQLLNLIDDIIDVAKIEANELKISISSCDIVKMIRDKFESYQQISKKIKQDQVELELDIPKNLETLPVDTDCRRLEQIITNLVNNALKFSKKGIIRLGFTIQKSDIEFFVSDEGMGIPKQKLDEIFERFKQLNYENAAEFGGTGLGLAICRGLVTLLGGKISVESKFNKGSTFRFTIPNKKSSIQEKKTIDLTDNDYFKTFNQKTILIADDEELIHYYFHEIFKEYNLQIISAKNGQDAVEKFKQHQEIDLVLMDLRMPIMDGIKATEEILKLNPAAKILAQTAYAMQSEKQKCEELGFVDYISKPIDQEFLFLKMKKWLEQSK